MITYTLTSKQTNKRDITVYFDTKQVYELPKSRGTGNYVMDMPDGKLYRCESIMDFIKYDGYRLKEIY